MSGSSAGSRLVLWWFKWSRLNLGGAVPIRTLDEVVRVLIDDLTSPPKVDERRQAERHLVMMPATMYALNDSFERISARIPIVVRDISENGIAVLFQDEIECNFLQVCFSAEYRGASLVFLPLRKKTIPTQKNGGLFIQVGGPFVKSGLER